MSSLDRVSAVLVSYHHGRTIVSAAESLRILGASLCETVIVDNAGDLSDAGLPSGARLITPGGNLGFAAAVNLAAGEARGEWLLLLSPDAEVVTWNSAQLEQTLRADVGVVGAFTVDHHGRPSVSWGGFPGVGRILDRVLRRDLRRNRAGVQKLVQGEGLEVPWVLGAAVVIRRETLIGLGGLCESYFASGEDQDLGARLRRRGLSTLVSPGWKVRHEPRNPESMDLEIRRNERLFVRTHGGPLDRLLWPPWARLSGFVKRWR